MLFLIFQTKLHLRPVFKSWKAPYPMITIKADGVILEGLKIEGVETDQKKAEIIALNKAGKKGVYEFPITRGIHVMASDHSIVNESAKSIQIRLGDNKKLELNK